MFQYDNQQEYMYKALVMYTEVYDKLFKHIKGIKSMRMDRQEKIEKQQDRMHTLMFTALGRCVHSISYVSEEDKDLDTIIENFQSDLEKITKTIMLSREKVLEYLRTEIKPQFNESGVINLALFGSIARNEYDEESDIDICYEPTAEFKQKYPNLDHLQFKEEIRKQISLHFERNVDIISVKAMNEFMLESVMIDVIYV